MGYTVRTWCDRLENHGWFWGGEYANHREIGSRGLYIILKSLRIGLHVAVSVIHWIARQKWLLHNQERIHQQPWWVSTYAYLKPTALIVCHILSCVSVIQALPTSNVTVEVLAKSLIGSTIGDTIIKLDWRVNGTQIPKFSYRWIDYWLWCHWQCLPFVRSHQLHLHQKPNIDV